MGEEVGKTRECASPVLYIPWLNEAAVEGGTAVVCPLRKVFGADVG
jgi:hypothetical protein